MRRLVREGLIHYRFLAAEETLLHRNVIAILTVVQATGGHVLWICSPLSSANQWEFVQDVLSSVATIWLWVDTCQFDINAHETWLFATSSQGMLPLASPCNHKSQLRMKGPHIKFSPNLRTRFATLVAPFVSGLEKTFHTLVGRYLSDICYRCQALPSSCRQDHLLGNLDVARGERWDHESQDFPTVTLGQQFQGVSFWSHPGDQA